MQMANYVSPKGRGEVPRWTLSPLSRAPMATMTSAATVGSQAL